MTLPLPIDNNFIFKPTTAEDTIQNFRTVQTSLGTCLNQLAHMNQLIVAQKAPVGSKMEQIIVLLQNIDFQLDSLSELTNEIQDQEAHIRAYAETSSYPAALSQPQKPPEASEGSVENSPQLDEREEDVIHAKFLQATDPAEKEALLNELIRLLTKHCLAVCSQYLQETRMDLSNGALMDIIKYLHTFEGRNGAKFSTWVHTIIRNICKKEVSKKIKDRTYWNQIVEGVVPSIEEGELYTPGASEEKKLHASLLLDRIRQSLDGEELILFDMTREGKSRAEMAEVLGGDENSVGCRWFRLKEKIKGNFSDSV